MSLRSATATINLNALVENFVAIKAMAPKSKILAVLKANAYGHGLERIGRALSSKNAQADAFGVARIDEALALRACGIVKPIVLLEGFFEESDLAVLAVNDLQTIVHSKEQLRLICDSKLDKPLKVWLKIDTGMHRLGISPQDFNYFYQQLSKSDNVQDDIIFMSHLGCADESDSQITEMQIACFDSVTKNFSNERSLANSAGICAWPAAHYQWVRPGLMLYGVSPMTKNAQILAPNIKPVMTLQSSLISVRQLPAGENVGYGATWQSTKATTIGVVAIGYGDGYPRHAENGTPVLINGRKVPLIGRVSMDMITVDLGINTTDEVGDLVTLWGDDLPVAEIARRSTTISYELLCNITRRVQIAVI
jgi:alanine racemase